MVLKSYKTTATYVDNYEIDDDWIDDEEDDIKKVTDMKDIFIDAKIKSLKFTDEVKKQIRFGNIFPLISLENSFDGYLGAYSELEFFSYRYHKTHGIYPDMFRIGNISTEKFLVELFKNINVPDEAYFKSIEQKQKNIVLNSIIIAFKDNLYLYLDTDEAVFFYDKKLEKDKNSILHTLVGLVKGKITPAVSKNKIYVVYSTQHGFEKTGFAVKKINVNLEDNYNEGFVEVSDEIIEGLNDRKKSNLVILSGEPGTGKTTYIRHLTSKIKKNIIFISPDMVSHITDPSFIPFLMKNNDTVLIIEDGEPALQSRDGGGRTGAVSNILNLTDGLLSDCLNISILVTFNMGSKDIDKALLRKGRLLKNYKFDRLSINKSKALLKKLGRPDVDVTEPMTLAEIYYYTEDNNSEEYKIRKIGFGN